MNTTRNVVFLVDVDDTLLDNDRAQDDFLEYLRRNIGKGAAERYWTIFRTLFDELGYADYLGALQRYRLENLHNPHLLMFSGFLLDYPFEDRLYPGALQVLNRLRRLGKTVILSDGDVVFQPRKIQRSGIYDAVKGRVLVYLHKEKQLDDVVRFYPADHYVCIDDKLRILAAVKQTWRRQVTTVQPLQGHYARDPKEQAAYPPADITIQRIEELLSYDLSSRIGSSFL